MLSWRRALDALGGLRRLEAQGRRYAERWRASVGGGARALSLWLARDGGGRFWIPVGSAHNWALTTWTPADQRIADGAAYGVVDLLGSGPVKVGPTPPWRRDLYTGREWPLRHAFRLGVPRGDGSDIRTVWEMSRGAYFVPLARAFWRSSDPRYRDTFARHVSSWRIENPLGRGPNWLAPREVALRAANWVLAILLFARADGLALEFWQDMLANLWTTALFLEREPEAHPAVGVGLAYLGALFRDTAAGERWLRAGAGILETEMQRRVNEDGTTCGASLGQHRLLTELFTYGGDIARRNLAGGMTAAYDQRLLRLYDFLNAYLPPSGEAPMLGDADDTRLHILSAEGWLAPRRHRLGLPSADDAVAAAAATTSTAFPEGGFYVLRAGDDHLIARCGPVRGAGSHDHNDHLSFELVVGGRRIIADSGTYACTRDLEERFAFRATAAHNVVQVGGEEQNPIVRERPWRVLADRTRSRCLRWEVGPEHAIFEGQHHGFAHRPSGAICRRRIVGRWRGQGGRWRITDDIIGTGTEPLTWRVHFAAIAVREGMLAPPRYELVLPGTPTLQLVVTAPPGFTMSLGESPASDRYGVRYMRPSLTLSGRAELPAHFDMTLSAHD